jgi:hypothetical protein
VGDAGEEGGVEGDDLIVDAADSRDLDSRREDLAKTRKRNRQYITDEEGDSDSPLEEVDRHDTVGILELKQLTSSCRFEVVEVRSQSVRLIQIDDCTRPMVSPRPSDDPTRLTRSLSNRAHGEHMDLLPRHQSLLDHPLQQMRRNDAPLTVRSEENDVRFPQRLYPFFPTEELLVETFDARLDLSFSFEGDGLDVEGAYLGGFEVRLDSVVHHRRELDTVDDIDIRNDSRQRTETKERTLYPWALQRRA